MTVTRRQVLGMGLATAAAAAAWPARLLAAGYRVGVGHDADAYHATQRALDASGEWPSVLVAGRRVVIKPNLVQPRPASTGSTTDPEVVRAVVDRALADGAASVQIVEHAGHGAFYTACGYDLFRTYDPDGRVQLVDLQESPQSLWPLAGGMAYGAISTADLLFGDDVVFVSAAKLKTHTDAVMSLSMKNLFGLPALDRYVSYMPQGRFAMHDRSLHQSVVDLNRLRPVDFAVVDGVWAMEGAGPLAGTPVRMDTVLAGRNALAVDRVAVSLTQLSPRSVRHLDYGAALGLGPRELDEITVAGDTLTPRTWVFPRLPPYVEYPRVSPAAFHPAAGEKTTVGVYYAQTCIRALDVLSVHDDRAAVDLVRTLKAYGTRAPGYEFIAWDGRGDDGTLAPPGLYAAHVRAFQPTGDGRPMDGMAWVTVVAA